MLSERQLEAVLKVFEQRAQELTDTYLRRIGEHIKAIGTATPSDVNRLVELKRMGANVDRMKAEIAKAMNAAAKDVEKVFYSIAETDYRFAEKFYGEGRQIPIKQNKALLRVLQAQLRQTQDAMANLSRTTVISNAYQDAVSAAVQAVQSGVTDYNSAIRSAVKNAAREGLRVEYASGNHRRLDSAVRMNVLDGARQLNQDVARQVGKEYGADGVEISAHALCAADHLPYQGTQMTSDDFEHLQVTLERPIGQWNCRHFAFPILLGVSEPTYNQAQLDYYRRNSDERITIGDVTKTRYEWSQEQRRIETAIREQKNVANLAKASGDDALRRTAQYNINRLDEAYSKVSQSAGLIEKRERMGVAGFRPVKATPPEKRFNLKPATSAPLQNPSQGGTISIGDTSPRFERPAGSLVQSYRDGLAQRFSTGSAAAQNAYDKYIPNGGAVEDGTYTGVAHYNPNNNAIFMNFAADEQRRSGIGTTWFHEHGHFVDANAGNVSSVLSYLLAISSDCKTYEKAVRKVNKFTKASDVRASIAKELIGIGNITHSIQDIFGGVIRKRYTPDCWGHTTQYWMTLGPAGVCMETFAHMFEASFEPDKQALMKKYLPKAWAEFERIMEEIL